MNEIFDLNFYLTVISSVIVIVVSIEILFFYRKKI